MIRVFQNRPALIDVCGAIWSGPCGDDGLFFHRCARLTHPDGDHECECGSTHPEEG